MIVHSGNHYLRTNAMDQGEGPSIILIHGMAASLNDWVYLTPALISSGYRVQALDLLGHGGSFKPGDPQDYHFDVLYDHLENWIGELRCNRRLHLIGHSLGGALSLRYVLNHPDAVQGLVLIDPLYSHFQLSFLMRLLRKYPIFGVLVYGLTPAWLISLLTKTEPSTGRRFPPMIHKNISAGYKRASPQILRIPRTVPDFTPQLYSVQNPTMVIWGERDATLKPASFPSLVAELPKGYGQSIPNCGHQPHLQEPAIVNRSIITFLESIKNCI
jgi:pimeloyl-ACP methyl ester carboxylesterase